jgi:hypothetical protein
MLHEDLLNTNDLNSAMHVIENSLITGEKIKNYTQLKRVITHLSKLYNYYAHKKDIQKYVDICIALIKNCLQPKLYLKDDAIEILLSSFYHYTTYYNISINNFNMLIISNIEQGWIPEENCLSKMITNKYITYENVFVLLEKINKLPKKLILQCVDLFYPVFGKILNKIEYGKTYKNSEYTEKEHLEYLQKYCQINLVEFYESIFERIDLYSIKFTSIIQIYKHILKQFSDNNLKISNKLFLLINNKIVFNKDNDNINEYINFVEKLTLDESILFYNSFSNSFDEIFTELKNQNKIETINNFENLNNLLNNTCGFKKLILHFDKIYSGEKNKTILSQILQTGKKHVIGNIEIDFIKKYIISNSIEINDELFILFANTNINSLLEYCFENKYQLTDTVVLKIHSTQIYEQLKIANIYNYYITDKVFNHVHQLLVYADKTVKDICSLLKSISIYKNDDDKDFITIKEQIISYHKQLELYKTSLTLDYNDNVTPEMIINADKPLIRYYLLNKYLEQQKSIKSTNTIIKKIIKKVVKKVENKSI